jgi:gluconate 5-dehydrogenase
VRYEWRKLKQAKFEGMRSSMTDMFRIDDKVAVVIGGAGGIGEAVAYGLAQYGGKVVVASRNLTNLQGVASGIHSKHGRESAAFQVDVTDEKSVTRLVEQVVAKFGTVDILVNSQGLNIKKPATEFPVNEWQQMFDINVAGTMLTCREFGKIMVEKKKGKVINFSSIRGGRATLWGGNEGYCATKGAVDMITRSLASEWAPYNINVNAIAPSLIATRLAERTMQDPERLQKYLANVPLKRVGRPEDVIGLSVFLASPASDFITGQIIYLDGGASAVV